MPHAAISAAAADAGVWIVFGPEAERVAADSRRGGVAAVAIASSDCGALRFCALDRMLGADRYGAVRRVVLAGAVPADAAAGVRAVLARSFHDAEVTTVAASGLATPSAAAARARAA